MGSVAAGMALLVSNSVHLVAVRTQSSPGAPIKLKVVRSRDIRFLGDPATPASDLLAFESLPATPLAADDPLLEAAVADPLGRVAYDGDHDDECSTCCDPDALLYICEYCPRAHCFSCTDATLPQLEGAWRCHVCRAQDASAPLHLAAEVDQLGGGNRDATFYPGATKKKWGVGVAEDDESEDEDEPLPDIDERHGRTVFPDMPRDELDRLMKRRVAITARLAALHARAARVAQQEEEAHAQHDARQGRRDRRDDRQSVAEIVSSAVDPFTAAALPPPVTTCSSNPDTSDEDEPLPLFADSDDRSEEDEAYEYNSVRYNRKFPRLASMAPSQPADSPPRSRPIHGVAATSSHVEPRPSQPPIWLAQTKVFGGVPLGFGTDPDGAWVMATTAEASGRSAKDIPPPLNYTQAERSKEWQMWQRAIDAELEQLGSRNWATIVPKRLVGNNLMITTTWVFTIKDDIDPMTGQPLLKFKARLTARGDLVDPIHINPDHLNAPTIDPEMVRVIMSLVAADPLCQFIQSDIVGAYLNVYLKTNAPPIFLKVPQGMQGVPEGHVLQLHINLYGLCEAAYRWYCDLAATLNAQGWTKHATESCLWFRQDDMTDQASRCYFLLHVDDSLTVGRKARQHYDKLASRYEMKDMGIPKLWCGIEFAFQKDVILLHQSAYRKYFVEHWRNHPVHPIVFTPYLTPLKEDALRQLDDLQPYHNENWYSEYCGMLNWLLVTGPDVTPGATLIMRGIGHVTPAYEAAAAHMLGYISVHLDLGITFDRLMPIVDGPLKLLQYVDAQYGNKRTGHSDEGQVIMLNGNLISWSTKRQTVVAANTYHAEVIAFSNGTRQLQKIKNYICGLGFVLPATPVFEDNQAVIRYGRDIGLSRAARTLAQHFHFGRDQQQLGLIDLVAVPSADNCADFFTKPLPKTLFAINVARLGMRSLAACAA